MSEAAARPKPYWGDPVSAKPTPELVSALNVFMTTTGYDWVRRNDEWPGEDYQGSSLNAACKLGRSMDWWTGWRWSLGTPTDKVRDVVTTLSYYGPVMFASTWRAGMWKVDQGGYLRYTGKDEGGHAYLLTAYSVSRQAVWTPNSWGGYGQGWITTSDLTSMFADDAEAAVAVGRKIKAIPWR